MYFLAIILAFTLRAIFGSAASTPTRCTSGAVVFAVRGSSKNPTANSDPAFYNVLPPEFTQIADAAIKKTGGGYLQAIAYPASDPNVNNGTNNKQSVAIGIASLQDTIYDYVDHCAKGSIVILGYSQGAVVVSSALAGSTTRGPLKCGERITTGALFADPAYHDGRFPLDRGSGANDGFDGTVPGNGTNYDNINAWYGRRLRSYCQAGDRVCDSGTGPDAQNIHLQAPATFVKAAQAFITSRLRRRW